MEIEQKRAPCNGSLILFLRPLADPCYRGSSPSACATKLGRAPLVRPGGTGVCRGVFSTPGCCMAPFGCFCVLWKSSQGTQEG